jgi:hypothetical protein
MICAFAISTPAHAKNMTPTTQKIPRMRENKFDNMGISSISEYILNRI